MRYQVIIKIEGEKKETYQSWDDVYEQELENLDIPAIVTFLNTNQARKVTRIRKNKKEEAFKTQQPAGNSGKITEVK